MVKYNSAVADCRQKNQEEDRSGHTNITASYTQGYLGVLEDCELVKLALSSFQRNNPAFGSVLV